MKLLFQLWLLTATSAWASCSGQPMAAVLSQLSTNGLNPRVVACSAIPTQIGVYGLLTDTDGMHFVYLNNPEPGVMTVNKHNKIVACRKFHLDDYRLPWDSVPIRDCWKSFNGDFE